MSNVDTVEENVQQFEELDTCGLFCPLPIVKTSERMKTMQVGETLLVISDDAGILEDMPAWCRANGHLLLNQQQTSGIYRMRIQKKGREDAL
jgi:tRNA 2-thiouridine synthesizing protein A